jgi:hypothetical protein
MISRQKFFVQGSRLPIEENTKIEFKNHKLISIEEMSGSGFIPRMAPIRIVFENSHIKWDASSQWSFRTKVKRKRSSGKRTPKVSRSL